MTIKQLENRISYLEYERIKIYKEIEMKYGVNWFGVIDKEIRDLKSTIQYFTEIDNLKKSYNWDREDKIKKIIN